MTVTSIDTDLDSLTAAALKKVNAPTENALCRYLPGVSRGYMHHITYKRLKRERPSHLMELLNKHILDPDQPKLLEAPPRAPRGSRQAVNGENLTLSRSNLSRLIKYAREAGDEKLVKAVIPQLRSLTQIKTELTRAIRHNEPARDLFEAYCQHVEAVDAV